jgi:CO/xanthine dehydrogenase FAD-binding subunit
MEYLSPTSLTEALKLKQEYQKGATIIAGGTDLLVRVKSGKESPKAILDLNHTGLNYIRLASNIEIGAMTSLTEIIEYDGLKQDCPILAEAAKEVGAIQTRSLATLVGNICTGIPSADMALPLLVLDASVVIEKVDGKREISIEDFFKSPRQIAVNDDEIVTEIIIPNTLPKGKKGSVFIKVGKRKAMRLSIVSVALNLDIDPETNIINDIKIAMGTVAPVPIRLKKIEELMVGKKLDNELVIQTKELIKDNISPRTSLRASKEYRQHLAEALFTRALKIAQNRALGREDNYDQ